MFKLLLKIFILDLQKKNWEAFKIKQAENGLQSRSSENGKTAMWHYGLKLYLTRDRGWIYGMVWYGLVWFGMVSFGMVLFCWYSLVWGTSEFIHEEISILDYNGLL